MERTASTDPMSVLGCLVDEPDEFLSTVFGRRAAVSRTIARRLTTDLASADHIEQIIGSGLRAPSLRIVKDGQTIPADKYSTGCDGDPEGSDAIIDTGAVLRALASGHTVVVRALHRLDRGFALLASQLRDELGEPIRVFAYLTPPGHQGLRMHYDTHDVFAVQCEGSKEWAYAPGSLVRPLPAQAWHLVGKQRRAAAVEQVAEPMTVTLSKGDVLYLPRGFLHSARSAAEFSVHLAVSVHPVTVHDVLGQVLKAAASGDWWRGRATEVGPDALREQMLQELRSVLAGTDMTTFLEAARAEAMTELPPPALDVIRQFRLVQARDDRAVVLRAGARIGVRSTGSRIEVRFGDARVLMPAEAGPAVAPLESGDMRGLEMLQLEQPQLYTEIRKALATIGVLVPAAGASG